MQKDGMIVNRDKGTVMVLGGKVGSMCEDGVNAEILDLVSKTCEEA